MSSFQNVKCSLVTNGPCCAQYLHRGCPPVPQGPLRFRNIHLGVCHKELLCHKTTQKSRGAQALLGRALGESQPEKTSPGMWKDDGWRMRTYKFNHPEKTTSALDKWVSWDVPRKQFYYFTIFAHNFYPLKPALILPINDSPVASVPVLFTPNFKKSSGHGLKLYMMEIFTHHQK